MALDPAKEEHYIAIWAKAVDTQMHFNEMSVKSRQLGLTFVAAALGVAVVLITRDEDFSITVDLHFMDLRLHVAVLLFVAALLAIRAVMVLDLNVYHRMLRGAVTFGEDFEQNYMKQIVSLNKGMTQAISHYSRYHDAKSEEGADGKYIYTGDRKISAEKKIRRFYYWTMFYLAVGALLLLFITNRTVQHETVPASATIASGDAPPADAVQPPKPIGGDDAPIPAAPGAAASDAGEGQ